MDEEESTVMGAKSVNVEISLEEMSQQLGLSAQRLGQIEARAFRKMRLLIAETDQFPILASMFEHAFHEYRVQDAMVMERRRIMSQKHNRIQRGLVMVRRRPL